jgi:hypothetical protein
MSNYILSNNQTFSDIFTPRGSTSLGNIISDSIGNTGINMSVIAGDTNPLTVQQTTNDNITFQTVSTSSINITQNNVPSMQIINANIIMNPGNFMNNIVMNNLLTTCFKQFNYGAIDISTNFTLLPYHPRNVFVTAANSATVTLTFPTTPPTGTFFRIIKVPATATDTFTINLSGGTFNLYSVGTITSVTSLPATGGRTVFECIYISELTRWQISTY